MPFPFARRASGFRRETNRLYQTHERVIAAGGAITDLISGQVTDQGLAYPADRLERIWAEASRAVAIYRPNPLGRPEAREAVAAYYRTRGVPVDPEHLLLTPGTSLAYWYAFSVLCNPGDEVLTPCPSYP
ncbi:MAG: aminotransferase class I/II-fold pyridoxal phosphate-dependent enzyme, partial [Nitrospiria bacterium]